MALSRTAARISGYLEGALREEASLEEAAEGKERDLGNKHPRPVKPNG